MLFLADGNWKKGTTPRIMLKVMESRNFPTRQRIGVLGEDCAVQLYQLDTRCSHLLLFSRGEVAKTQASLVCCSMISVGSCLECVFYCFVLATFKVRSARLFAG